MTALVATPTDAIDPKELLKVLSDYRDGNFSVRLPVDHPGTTGKIYDTLNEVMALNQRMATELARISSAVSKGDLSQIKAEIAERQCVEIERAQLLDRERRGRLEAQAMNRMKDEFLATLSHELRTPLNAILGWTHILEVGSRDDAAIDRATRIIKRNAEAQAHLVEDILDVSSIIGGKLNLKLELVNLRAVIEAALEAVTPAAGAKRIAIETVFGDLAPIVADRDRLHQIMWNLLSNAIKFTPKEGRVRIDMQAQSRDIVVKISDSGQGIDPRFLPHVFERFTQADGSFSRLHWGLGLGMAIVRHLVELHGGSVTAASDGKDQGATFTVTLPLGARPVGDAMPGLDDLTVLAVDDHADAREVVELTPVGGQSRSSGS